MNIQRPVALFLILVNLMAVSARGSSQTLSAPQGESLPVTGVTLFSSGVGWRGIKGVGAVSNYVLLLGQDAPHSAAFLFCLAGKFPEQIRRCFQRRCPPGVDHSFGEVIAVRQAFVFFIMGSWCR